MSTPPLERLNALPKKVSAPLLNLYRTGHLDNSSLSDILDAGQLDGNLQMLLGFAVAYSGMLAKSVPISDTLRMATEQDRKIRMSWSPKRWQTEHDRFSRAETLIRLSKQDTKYDVSVFDELLPTKFPGYLIRNSRRLGMEGLRQRHCIASYNDGLEAARYAIAVVFIDRVRWTVQLTPTGNQDSPLRISQVKTRRNRSAEPETITKIRSVLGIPEPIHGKSNASSSSTRRNPPRLYMQNLRLVLPVLIDQGVRLVEVSFDGGGDSGSIDDVDFMGGPPEVRAIGIRILKAVSTFKEDRWVNETEEVDVDLEEAIRNLTDDYLEETNVDWYNNDGGYGSLCIHPEQGTVELDVNTRFTESTGAFHAINEIVTGDQL